MIVATISFFFLNVLHNIKYFIEENLFMLLKYCTAWNITAIMSTNAATMQHMEEAFDYNVAQDKEYKSRIYLK